MFIIVGLSKSGSEQGQCMYCVIGGYVSSNLCVSSITIIIIIVIRRNKVSCAVEFPVFWLLLIASQWCFLYSGNCCQRLDQVRGQEAWACLTVWCWDWPVSESWVSLDFGSPIPCIGGVLICHSPKGFSSQWWALSRSVISLGAAKRCQPNATTPLLIGLMHSF